MSIKRFKISAAPPEATPEETDVAPSQKKVRNALMLAAGVAPFGSLIGERPKIHEGKGREFTSLEELKGVINPGDVVLSAPKKKDLTSLGVGLFSNGFNGDTSHSAFVDDHGRMVSTALNGPFAPGPRIETWDPTRTYTVLRPKADRLNPAELGRRYREQFDAANALIRNAPSATHEKLRKKFYVDLPDIIHMGLRETYLPRLGGASTGDAAKKRFKEFLAKPSLDTAHSCASGWCSFPGAISLPEGMDVVPGKSPFNTAPTDFMRSDLFEPVGGYQRGRKSLANTAMTHGQTAGRLAFSGLGMGAVYGADKALSALKRKLRQRKDAKNQTKTSDEKETPENYADASHVGRNVLMGAGMSAPWLGAVGEKKKLAPMTGGLSVPELLERAQAGDVIVTGDAAPSLAKTWISFASGSPQEYHVAHVGNDRNVLEFNDGGVLNKKLSDPALFGPDPAAKHHVRLLRPKPGALSEQAVQHQLKSLEGLHAAQQRFTSRIRERALSIPDMAPYADAIAEEAGHGFYGETNAGILAREMFVPKVKGADAIAAERAKTVSARDAFIKNPHAAADTLIDGLQARKFYEPSQVASREKQLLTRLVKRVPALKPVIAGATTPPKDLLRKAVPSCATGVCSTGGAPYLPDGVSVVPGKIDQHLLPSDYLRASHLYDEVGSSSPGQAFHEKLLRQSLPAYRLGTGLATAGAVYGLDRARHAITQRVKAHRHKKKTAP